MVRPAGEAAFVTGAASRVGLDLPRALVAAGARVALADIDRARRADAASEPTAAGGVVTTVELDGRHGPDISARMLVSGTNPIAS
ncbi:hypothetical protein [Nocardia sp. NPDC004860]|uniref:hypothetical protein n=1 Tax=Nocardia sp. NPDC004860 TaxID=3154557 RepID=UPI0033A668B3